MNTKIARLGMLALVSVSSVGCATASKFAWWKSSDAAEATAMAHAAPELPSDAAKDAEKALQVADGEAATFVPGQVAQTAATTAPATVAPGADYPKTNAPSFSPETAVAAVTAGRTSGLADATAANLGSVTMPYDPNAAPAAAVATTSTSQPAAARYGGGADLTTGSYVQTTPVANQTTVDPASAAPVAGASTPAGGQVAAAATTPVGDRYGMTSPSRYASSATTPSTTSNVSPASASAPGGAMVGTHAASGAVAAVQQAPAESDAAGNASDSAALAETTPYRPGGTGTYPSNPAGAAVEVASRPAASTTVEQASMPGAGTAPTPPAGSVAPQTTPRYW